jgi:hypothetical protein
MGWDLKARKVTVFDTGDQLFDVSTLDRVAHTIVATLQHYEETKNRYVYVKSFTLSQNKLLQVIEKLSGAKFEVAKGSTQEIGVRGRAHLDQRDFEHGYPEVVTAVAYGPWDFIYFREKADKWNTVLELPDEEPLESVVTDVLKRNSLVH